MNDDITIVSGGILFYRLYDVAWEIDLQRAEENIKGSKRFGIDRKLFSKAFEFKNPPITIKLSSFETVLNGKSYTLNSYGKAYDYGVLSIIFDIPLSGVKIRELETLAQFLRDREPLVDDSRKELDGLMRYLGDAMKGVKISPIEEDYTVYYVRKMDREITADEFLVSCDIGRLLLHEEGEFPPGRTTMRELLSNRLSYSHRDLVVINWDNAIVLESAKSMDIPDLLEFATAQLLELRVYDQMLDNELDAIYERISPRVSPSIWKIKSYEGLAARVMRTITELTEITEKVDNSLKVTEDVYYAKVYAMATSLFKVKGWEASIRRKIDIASKVYDMLYRDISNKRIELLELVIVLLIALEIVLFLIKGA